MERNLFLRSEAHHRFILRGSAISMAKLLALSALLVLVAAGLLMAFSLRQGLEGRTLIIGVSPDLPPLEYWYNGSLKGISIDLAEYAARRSGYANVRYRYIPYRDLLQAVENGTVDAAAGVLFTGSSVGRVLLTKPYYNVTLLVIGVSAHPPASLEGFNNLRVGVPSDDPLARSLLTSLRTRYNYNVTLVNASLPSHAVRIAGYAARIMDVVATTRQVSCSGAPCTEITLRFSFAVGKDNTELLTKLNDSIEEASSSGKLEEIVKKYYRGGTFS